MISDLWLLGNQEAYIVLVLVDYLGLHRKTMIIGCASLQY